MKARFLVCLFFFLSGAAGLIYQVVWTKLLGLVLGNTVYSITIVLAAFMGGLGLGSYVGGRIADRLKNPLLTYGLLEGIIGIYCALVPFLVSLAQVVFRSLGSSLSGSPNLLLVIRLLVAAGLLLLPATLMGATLPILSRFFVVSRERFGSSLAKLYAINTFGAVAGSFLAGFALIPYLGLLLTSWVGAAANLLVLALTLWVCRGLGSPSSRHGLLVDEPEPEQTGGPELSSKDQRTRRVALLVIALAGMASLIDQIAWTRVLALCLGSSVYAFSTMVGTFIFGLAVGSALVGKIVDRFKDPMLLLAAIELLVGAAVLSTIWILGTFPVVVADLVAEHGGSFSRLLFEESWRVGLILLVPTAVMGAAFPVAARAYATGRVSVAKAVGTVYSANTGGAILGSILGGFLLLPVFGTRGLLILACVVNGVAGLLALAGRFRQVRSKEGLAVVFSGFLFVGLFLGLPDWDPKIMTCGPFLYGHIYRENEKAGQGDLRAQLAELRLPFFKDGISATVTVFEDPQDGSYALAVNGKIDASTSGDMPTQLLLGHLPIGLHPGPAKDVLVVGLGSGATVAATLRHQEVERADCVEISGGIIEAARLFFGRVNDDVLKPGVDSRVNVIEDDARNFISLSTRQYDVITSEPSNPWMAGIGSLFSVEFFELCRDRLKPDGVMCQWVHSEGISRKDFKVILRTFLNGFDDVLLFEAIPLGDYLLIGAKSRISISVAELSGRLAESGPKRSLDRVGIEGAASFLSTFVAGRDVLDAFCGDGPLHTDDNSYLEFSTPRSLYDRAEIIQQELELLTLEDGVQPRLVFDGMSDRNREELLSDLDRKSRGRKLVRVGANELQKGDAAGAAAKFTEALAALPGDPYLIEKLMDLKLREANALFKEGRGLPRIERLAREALALDPSDGRPDELLGYLALATNKLNEAISYLTQSVSKRPRVHLAWMNLGVAKLRSQDLAGAESSLKKALDLAPDSMDVLLNLANVYLRQGRNGEAEKMYGDIVEREPDDLEALQGLYMALQAQNRAADGVSRLREARERASAEARNQIDALLRSLGQ